MYKHAMNMWIAVSSSCTALLYLISGSKECRKTKQQNRWLVKKPSRRGRNQPKYVFSVGPKFVNS